MPVSEVHFLKSEINRQGTYIAPFNKEIQIVAPKT